jgi:hypothetical protein
MCQRTIKEEARNVPRLEIWSNAWERVFGATLHVWFASVIVKWLDIHLKSSAQDNFVVRAITNSTLRENERTRERENERKRERDKKQNVRRRRAQKYNTNKISTSIMKKAWKKDRRRRRKQHGRKRLNRVLVMSLSG